MYEGLGNETGRGGGGGGGGGGSNLPMMSRDHKSTHYQFWVPLDPPLVPIGALTV